MVNDKNQPAKNGIKAAKERLRKKKQAIQDRKEASLSPDNQLTENNSFQDTPPPLMDKHEAIMAIDELNNHVKSAMEICYNLEHRKGYEALGYRTFKACIEAELKSISYDQAFKLKESAKIHKLVCSEIAMGNIKEGVFRPLYQLDDEDKKQVWQEAVQKCGNPLLVTSATVKAAIECLKHDKTENINDTEDDPVLIKIPEKLTDTIGKKVLESIRENSGIAVGESVSSKQYKEAIKSLVTDLEYFLLKQYDELYPAS